jgi:mono/diheme cytochrome c family protein
MVATLIHDITWRAWTLCGLPRQTSRRTRVEFQPRPLPVKILMNRMKASVGIFLSAFLAHTRVTLAQSTATVPPMSTQGGVYTSEQAARGKNVYFGKCRSCHDPSTGDAFARLWAGKTVGDLFSYVLKTMPSNDPGTLDPYDDADVVAYLLQVTGMPTGQRELPADTDSLKAIRIDMKDAKKDPPPISSTQTERARSLTRQRGSMPLRACERARSGSGAGCRARQP